MYTSVHVCIVHVCIVCVFHHNMWVTCELTILELKLYGNSKLYHSKLGLGAVHCVAM